MNSTALIIVHLLCATIFMGIVAFEVLILEGIRPHLPAKYMSLVEEGIHKRGRKVMPYVVATLFISGITMAVGYFRGMGWEPFSSSFGIFLSIKILLALSVLIHFILAMKHSICGSMTSLRFKVTHLSVFIHMIFIIILAKGMFYFTI